MEREDLNIFLNCSIFDMLYFYMYFFRRLVYTQRPFFKDYQKFKVVLPRPVYITPFEFFEKLSL